MQQENIIEAHYELMKYMLPVLKKFPRDQRFLLGDRIQTHLMEIQEHLIAAYYSPRKAKPPLLHQVNIRLEQLRYFLRLGYDMQYCNAQQYEIIIGWLGNIGKQNGGWLKSLKRQ